MRTYVIISLLVFLGTATVLPAQQLPPKKPLLPEDYSPEEFPLWTHDLRRYEIVTIGSFPFTFFATSLIYDFSVYAANGFNPEYSMGSRRGEDDIGIIVGSAACVSLVIAMVDLIINVSKRKKMESHTNES